jgi:four helix bundle protein
MTLRPPRYETYEEGSQVRRSSKSIASCIVEGFGRRKYKSDFIRFLIYAHGSCDETIVHLNFIKDSHESVMDEITPLQVEYNELGAKINRFIKYVQKQWKEEK